MKESRLLHVIRNKEKGGSRRGFCKNVRLFGCAALSAPMYCWAQCPWFFFVSWSVTLGPTETLFAKPPFLGPSFKEVTQGHPFPEMIRGILVFGFRGGFLGDFFVDFSGHFPWKNKQEKIHRKIHQTIHYFQGTFLTKIHSGKFLP